MPGTLCYMSHTLCMQETEVAPIIADHWERASFPFEIIPKLRKLNLGKYVHRSAVWRPI